MRRGIGGSENFLPCNLFRWWTNPRRTWLTDHSMGGHGTWHLGVAYPDMFAPIGPSAGWIRMARLATGLASPVVRSFPKFSAKNLT
jgi:hypothetical protein